MAVPAARAVLIGKKPYPVELKPARAFYTPYGDQVAVQVWDASGVTEAGIELPDVSRQHHETALATVVAVGPECKQVKAGDVVLLASQTPAINVFSQGAKLTQIMEKYVVGVHTGPDALPGRWAEPPAG